MSNELTQTKDFNPYELALIKGDLSKISDEERLSYVNKLCQSLNLNPLTKPFEYIVLNGKLTLYANKGLCEQLRSVRGISIYKLERSQTANILVVTAYAKDLSGREDMATGAVSIEGLKGDALANAIMKAETKAKRRVTLSICGLNMLDESELETIKEKKAFNTNVTPKSSLELIEKGNELKQKGSVLRAFLEQEMGLDKEGQDKFIKENALCSVELIDKFLKEQGA